MKIVESITDRRLKNAEQKLLEAGLLKIGGISKTSKLISPWGNRESQLGIVINILKYLNTRNTYYVPKSKRVQCYSNHSRSMGDIFRIMKCYYPDLTLKELRSLIFEHVNNCNIYTDYCDQIKKRVFSLINKEFHQFSHPLIYGNRNKDEFGFYLKLEE